jgi:uncharacterized protein
MPTVTTQGIGSAPVAPDRLEVVLTVTADEEAPDAALDAAARREAALRQVLDELEIAGAARTTTGASVREREEYDRESGREVRVGYRATAVQVVKLDSPEVLGILMREVTSKAGAQVQGPIWRVAQDHPAWLEACRAAALNARRRAEAYAEALGLVVGEVLAATEAVVPSQGHVLSGSAAAVGYRPTSEMPISPGEQSLTASVEVTFDLVK